MTDYRVFRSYSTNPYVNLAIEDWIFRKLLDEEEIILFWQSEPAVVMGRFQNPWVETNPLYLEEQDIHLVRRQTGGGCVVHDEGNLNFVIFNKRSNYDKKENLMFMQDYFSGLGRELNITERNDLTFKGKKVSGSAFKENFDKCFHHGTLLLNSNLKALSRCLTPLKLDIQTRGVTSVRSPVVNLNLPVHEVIPEEAEPIEEWYDFDYIAEKSRELASEDWIYGEAPEYIFQQKKVVKGRYNGRWVHHNPNEFFEFEA